MKLLLLLAILGLSGCASYSARIEARDPVSGSVAVEAVSARKEIDTLITGYGFASAADEAVLAQMAYDPKLVARWTKRRNRGLILGSQSTSVSLAVESDLLLV